MSSIDCRDCQALIDRRWDDDVTPEIEAQIDHHMGACPTCADYAARLDELLSTAAELKEITYEREITVAPLVLGAPGRRTPWLLPWVAGLATATATLFVGLYIGRAPSAPVPVEPPGVLVRFVVPAPEANSVAVVGDFTDWRDPVPLAAAGEGLWVGELALPAGRYQYVIVVDGERMQPDPAARQVVDDGFGGQSSVLTVGSL